ncbi:MAG TPA: phosphatase PAP2 family protein [Dehalococcoidia bacterium]|nr:phosphatase PAP2 family protein [Dehalococcoidia bacterium]
MTSDSFAARSVGFLSGHPAWRVGAELALAAMAFLLYFVVRANVVDRPDLAIENARHVVDWEKTLGLFHEAAWQDWTLDSRLAVRFFNFVYFWLDFPLIAALGLLMYFRRRRQYTFTRDAILCSGALALVCYQLFPIAPPRLLPGSGLVDTLQVFNNLSYQAQSTSFFVNPYAAMPSLHVGWAFLLSFGVLAAFPRNRLVLALALIHPPLQWASTVMTGNHYFIDGAGGLVAAIGGLCFAYAMQRWGYRALGRFMGRENERRDGASASSAASRPMRRSGRS